LVFLLSFSLADLLLRFYFFHSAFLWFTCYQEYTTRWHLAPLWSNSTCLWSWSIFRLTVNLVELHFAIMILRKVTLWNFNRIELGCDYDFVKLIPSSVAHIFLIEDVSLYLTCVVFDIDMTPTFMITLNYVIFKKLFVLVLCLLFASLFHRNSLCVRILSLWCIYSWVLVCSWYIKWISWRCNHWLGYLVQAT